MSFAEYRPSEASFDAPRSSLLRTLAMAPALPFVLLFHTWPSLARLVFGSQATRVDSDGWRAEWTSPRYGCPYCLARMERLDLNGAPYPVPLIWKTDSCPAFRALATPAGVFMPARRRWRRGHWELPPVVVRGTFDKEDVERGWYPTDYVDIATAAPRPRDSQTPPASSSPVFRKAGTPGHWCLLNAAAPHWLDPLRLDEVLRLPAVEQSFRLGARCEHCGYDLSGNVSGRCPECGEAVREERTDDAAGEG